jgi:hypothetical protein
VVSEYLAVYHLHQDPGPGGAGEIGDATSNARDGTAEPSMTDLDSVAGQIGRAIDLDGSNDVIAVPAMDVGSSFTISVWLNMAAGITQIRTLIASSDDGATTDGFRFFVNSNGTADRRVRFETGNGSATNSAITPMNAIPAAQWTHVAALVDRAAGTATIVVNGALASSADSTIRSDFSTSDDLEIGRMKVNNAFLGMLDELEIAATTRPIEWITTAFNNQVAPGSFHGLGPEELAPER